MTGGAGCVGAGPGPCPLTAPATLSSQTLAKSHPLGQKKREGKGWKNGNCSQLENLPDWSAKYNSGESARMTHCKSTPVS